MTKTIKKSYKQKVIIGLYFGSYSSGYYIIQDNNIQSNISGTFLSELILDEETQKGFKYGDEAHNYKKNEIKNSTKIYFSKFKKYLDPRNNENDYNNLIESDFPLGHKIPLKTIIIQYLSLFKKDNIDNYLDNINKDKYEIKWILTVPGLWDEKGKIFMNNICGYLGIENSEIILEQEASSLSMLYDNNVNKKYLQNNNNFILIDLGFSSVDICVNKIIKDNNLKQLIQPKSFRLGSSSINQKIIEVIESVCDKDKINKCKTENYDTWQITLDEIEAKKKDIEESTSGNIRILIPFNQKLWTFFGFIDIREGKYKNRKIRYNKEYIDIPSDIIKSFINDAATNIIKEINNIIEEMNKMKEKIGILIFIGGFANSKILQNKINNEFKSYLVYFFPDQKDTITKGAAIYGLYPNKILYRVSPVTIGIGIYIDFEEEKGICEPRIKNENGEIFCFKILSIIQKGQILKSNEIIKKRNINPWNLDKINIDIFSTFNDDFSSKDEINKLGDIKLNFVEVNPNLKKKNIDISMKFTNYITVTVFEKGKKNENSTIFYYPS